MADEKISVIIGAQIEGLLAGIAESKEAIEGLREPIDSFVADLGGIAEAIGVAFAVEKIKEFATEMAEAGEKALNSAYILGQSVKEYETLSGAMVLVGGDAGDAQRTLERLGLSAQRVAEGNKAATAAFHNLGISTAEVQTKGNNLTDLLTLLIERFGELEPSLRNIGVLHEIAGRGVDRLAAAMRSGGDGWREMLEAAKEYGAVAAAIDPQTADTEEKINALRLHVMQLKDEGFSVLKPVIDTVVEGLDQFVQTLNRALVPLDAVKRDTSDLKGEMSDLEVAMRGAIKWISDIITAFKLMGDTLNYLKTATQEWGEWTHAYFVGIKDQIVATFSGGDVEAAYQQMMGRLEAITVSRGAAMLAEWKNIVAGMAQLADPNAHSNISLNLDVPADAKHGTRKLGTEGGGQGKKDKKGTDDRLAQWREELQQKLIAEENYFKDSKAEELAFWQQKLALAQSGSKEDEKIRLQVESNIYNLKKALAHQDEADRLSTIKSQEALTDEQFNRAKAQIAANAQLGKITATQEVAQEKALNDEKWAYDQAYFEKRKAAAQGDLATQKKIDQEEQSAHEQYLTRVQALDNQAALATKSAWDQVLQPITSAFEQSINGMIAGTQTLHQAVTKILQSILAEFVNTCAKMLERWISTELAETAFTEAQSAIRGAGGGASGLLSGILGKITGGLIGTALGGPVGGFFGSEAGSMALNSLPNFEKGGRVPSAAGGWALPSMPSSGTLAQLHSNEMVLPAAIASGLQNAINGGSFGGGPSVNHTWNISALDAQSFAKFARANSQTFLQAINSATRQGGALRPNGAY